ncbi:MAG TPA: hypothetical protein VF432_25725 [Thermoanaerobaculia bacterium]
MAGDIISGCCGTAVLLLLLALGVAWIGDKLWLRRFRHQNAGRVFLLASRRHGWFEFITNNVEPSLPGDAHVAWLSRDHVDPLHRALRLSSHPDVPRPILVYVTRRHLRAVSVHDALLAFKTSARRDVTVQREVGAIVTSALVRLKARDEWWRGAGAG